MNFTTFSLLFASNFFTIFFSIPFFQGQRNILNLRHYFKHN
jgi:hypothetical protein